MSRTAVTLGLSGLLAWAPAVPAWGAGLGDPTQPPAATVPAPPQPDPTPEPDPAALILHSILIASERRLAIINQRLLGVGGRIEGAEITEIRPDAVVLRRDDQDLTLTLDLPAVKHPPGAPP